MWGKEKGKGERKRGDWKKEGEILIYPNDLKCEKGKGERGYYTLDRLQSREKRKERKLGLLEKKKRGGRIDLKVLPFPQEGEGERKEKRGVPTFLKLLC